MKYHRLSFVRLIRATKIRKHAQTDFRRLFRPIVTTSYDCILHCVNNGILRHINCVIQQVHTLSIADTYFHYPHTAHHSKQHEDLSNKWTVLVFFTDGKRQFDEDVNSNKTPYRKSSVIYGEQPSCESTLIASNIMTIFTFGYTVVGTNDSLIPYSDTV